MSTHASELSSEEVYASPVLISNPQGSLSPLSPDGRARRTRGTSSDKHPIHGSLINEDFRAGGPNLPAIPCDTLRLAEDHLVARIWKEDPSFIKEILQALGKNDVQVKSVELFQRKSSRRRHHIDDDDTVATVVVSAKKVQLDVSWLRACIKIRNIFIHRELHSLNIEILDSRSCAERLPFPVLLTDPIFPRWSEVSSRIRHEGWLALECFRHGISYEQIDNPVTIILTIPYDSCKKWKPIREAIVTVLNELSLPEVAISIVRGEIWKRGGFNPVPRLADAWG